MKKCPFCAEVIQDEAIKCRFCGSDLLASAGRPGQPSPEVVCGYCRTRNPAGGGACRTCGRTLPLRGLQYTATTPVPKKTRTLGERIAVAVGWLLMLAMLGAGALYVWRTFGAG